MNNLNTLIVKIKLTPEKITFKEVIDIIEQHYDYSPTRFTNGAGNARIVNNTGENEGSCKIFSFAQLHQLNEEQTLNCFGDYYRKDVLLDPESSNHANIRTFIEHGWELIHFDGIVLERKET